jgi:hypothetical protein
MPTISPLEINAEKSLIHMPKNACSQINFGNFKKNPPTSLFAEKVSIILAELSYQINNVNNGMLLKEKKVTHDAKGFMIFPRTSAPGKSYNSSVMQP